MIIALPEQVISGLQGVNCHMGSGSHIVTFHQTQVNSPR